MIATDEAVEAARKHLAKRKWSVPKSDETLVRHLKEALQAGLDALEGSAKSVSKVPSGSNASK